MAEYQKQQKEKEEEQQRELDKQQQQQQQRKSSTMPRNTAPSGAPLSLAPFDDDERPATRTGVHRNL